MSVYVVTRDQRLLRYDSPRYGKSVWLRSLADGDYHIYYKTCDCVSCEVDAHRQLIAYVQAKAVSSIGFEKPVVVEGRLLTDNEKRNLTNIREWLLKHGPVKRKLNAAVLDVVAK